MPHGRARSFGPYVERSRADWAELAEQHALGLDADDAGAGPRPRRPDLPAGRPRGLPAADRAAHPLRAATPASCTARPTSSCTFGRPDAVRDRHRRLGRGRQVDDRAAAARAARRLARAPAGRAGDHRRLPAPQRRARAARPDGPQGLPRVVRPPGAAAVRDGREVGPRGGRRRRSTATWSTTSCPASRSCVRQPGHPHRRGPERAAARRRPRPTAPAGWRSATSSTSRSTSTPTPPTSATGTSPGSCRCARPRSATRARSSPATPS